MPSETDPARAPLPRTPPTPSPLSSVDRAVTTAAEWALRLGILAFVAAVAYLLYGMLFGASPTMLDPANRVRVLQNFALGLRLLVWGWGITAIALAVLYYSEEATGYALAIAAVVAYFGMPLAASSVYSEAGQELFALIRDAALRMGVLAVVPGIVVIAYDLRLRVSAAWSGKRRSAVVDAPKEDDFDPGPGTFPWRCWQTSYCRPYVRDACPRYIERRPCWRRKEGCFCEERIVFRALERREDRARVFSNMRNLLDGPLGRVRELTRSEKRARCRRCPIYASHQRLKYKMLMPLAFPAAFLLLWWNADRIRSLIAGSLKWLDTVTARFAFGVPGAGQAKPEAGIDIGMDALPVEVVYWGLMVFLAVLLLTWMLKLVEWLVFKVQV